MFASVLYGEFLAFFVRMDRLVLCPVVLKHPPDILHQRNKQYVSHKDAHLYDTVDYVEPNASHTDISAQQGSHAQGGKVRYHHEKENRSAKRKETNAFCQQGVPF